MLILFNSSFQADKQKHFGIFSLWLFFSKQFLAQRSFSMQSYRLNVYSGGEAGYSINKTVRFANCFQPTHALLLLVPSQAQKKKKRKGLFQAGIWGGKEIRLKKRKSFQIKIKNYVKLNTSSWGDPLKNRMMLISWIWLWLQFLHHFATIWECNK